jgi:hypothetical protein
VLLGALACSADDIQQPTVERSQSAVAVEVQQAWLARDAADQVLQALGGRRERGEQEEMLRVERGLPGFGGFFTTEEGEVLLVSTSVTQRRETELRSRLVFSSWGALIPCSVT